MEAQPLYVRTTSAPSQCEHDWDEEARALFLRLNLDEGAGARERHRNVDAVFRHPTTGAKLFIGNQTAARSETVLEDESIFHIVNCQDESAANFFELDSRFHYKRFPVSHWRREPDVDSHAGVVRFFEEGCHAFIDEALRNGHNVMVHCLAGAHRAGTAGCSFMMREGKLDVRTAIRLAKLQRPVVDPFGTLLDLL